MAGAPGFMRAAGVPLSLVTIVSFAVLPAGAGADDAESAKLHFQQGALLYNEGDYEKALIEFKESYSIKPNWKVRFSIGVTLHALHRFVEAGEELQEYLAEGGTMVPDDKREQAMDLLGQIEGVIGTLTVSCDVQGASVLVNGEPAGKTPLPAPLKLDVGAYKVTVAADGYEEFKASVSVAGGKKVSLTASLVKRKAEENEPVEAAAPAMPAAAGSAGKKRMEHAGWGLLAAGAAMLVAGAATGGMVLSIGGDIEDKCPDGVCPPPYHDDNEKMKRLALATDILLPLGGACALAGAVLAAVGKKKGGKEKKTVQLSPLLPFGIAVSGGY